MTSIVLLPSSVIAIVEWLAQIRRVEESEPESRVKGELIGSCFSCPSFVRKEVREVEGSELTIGLVPSRKGGKSTPLPDKIGLCKCRDPCKVPRIAGLRPEDSGRYLAKQLNFGVMLVAPARQERGDQDR